jgi:hypothetical protein
MSLTSADEGHLLRAIELDESPARRATIPDSLLVDTSEDVVLEAENTVVTGRDVTGHAELNLVRAASMHIDVEALLLSTLFTSTEPVRDVCERDLLVRDRASRVCARQRATHGDGGRRDPLRWRSRAVRYSIEVGEASRSVGQTSSKRRRPSTRGSGLAR